MPSFCAGIAGHPKIRPGRERDAAHFGPIRNTRSFELIGKKSFVKNFHPFFDDFVRILFLKCILNKPENLLWRKPETRHIKKKKINGKTVRYLSEIVEYLDGEKTNTLFEMKVENDKFIPQIGSYSDDFKNKLIEFGSDYKGLPNN